LTAPYAIARLPDPNDGSYTDALFEAFGTTYAETGAPVRVDFRALMPSASATERATHLIHPYPAKLLRHIPALFLSANQLSRPGDSVLDPFCGSGTVLVESLLAGRRAIGADTNPLACLIAKVKTTPLRDRDLPRTLERVIARARDISNAAIPNRSALAPWFHPRMLRELARIRAAIARVRDEDVRDFFSVCFSSTVRTASLADPRISVPVRQRPSRYSKHDWLHARAVRRLADLERTSAYELFSRIAEANMDRLAGLPLEVARGDAHTELADARNITCNTVDSSVLAGQVDLVLTSPPYLGAQKYVRACSLSLLWLDLVPDGNLQTLARVSIGREHFRKGDYERPTLSGVPDADAVISAVRPINPLRAHLAATYLTEMRAALGRIATALKPSGAIVLVAGGNSLCGRDFDTPGYLTDLAAERGLTLEFALVDKIRSRGLMTRRNRSASPISEEVILVLRKGHAQRVRA
jgi:hypothetical protein